MVELQLKSSSDINVRMIFSVKTEEIACLTIYIRQSDFSISSSFVVAVKEILQMKEMVLNTLNKRENRFEFSSSNKVFYLAMLRKNPTETDCNIRIALGIDKDDFYNSFFSMSDKELSSLVVQLNDILTIGKDSFPKSEMSVVNENSSKSINLVLHPHKILVDKLIGEKVVFDMMLTCEHVRVNRELTMWGDEFLSFKKDLLRLSQEESNFACEPFGEFALFQFKRTSDIVSLYVELLDTSWPQNGLFLHGMLSFLNINQLLSSLEDVNHIPKFMIIGETEKCRITGTGF